MPLSPADVDLDGLDALLALDDDQRAAMLAAISSDASDVIEGAAKKLAAELDQTKKLELQQVEAQETMDNVWDMYVGGGVDLAYDDGADDAEGDDEEDDDGEAYGEVVDDARRAFERVFLVAFQRAGGSAELQKKLKR
jgi:hypothetical protein